MSCLKCGAEVDELNESQAVCPGCGVMPSSGGDSADVTAVLEDAALIATVTPEAEEPDFERTEPPDELTRLPLDLQMVLDEAEALLLATGSAGFTVPARGFRLFPLPTERLM
jgi:hypothetical protein